MFWGLLDDPTGLIYVDYPTVAPTISVFQPAFRQAYSALYSAFLNAQCPRIELIMPVTVPANTTALTPGDMGIDNFGDFIWLRERALGSNNKFGYLQPRDDLSQRSPEPLLREFVWRNNTFYFVGATQNIELEVKYDTSSVAPVNNNAIIAVDDCDSFLANYAVGQAGPRKGDTEIAARCMMFAVGPKYDQGTIGGELFRLIQPLVRSRQNVQIAHRPYSSRNRGWGLRWTTPFVAAQQGTTGGGAMNVPIQYSTDPTQGGIVGPVDGVNAIFWLETGAVSSLLVFRNGVAQTYGLDYTNINNQITFLPNSIPVVGDVITAEAFNSGVPQPVAPPDRTMSNSGTFGSVAIFDGTTVLLGTIPVPGCVVGNGVTWGVQTPLPQGMDLIVSVNAPNLVTVQLRSLAGSGATPTDPIIVPANVYFVTVTQ